MSSATLNCTVTPAQAARRVVSRTDGCTIELAPGTARDIASTAVYVSEGPQEDSVLLRLWHVTQVAVAARRAGQDTTLKRVLPASTPEAACPASRCSTDL